MIVHYIAWYIPFSLFALLAFAMAVDDRIVENKLIQALLFPITAGGWLVIGVIFGTVDYVIPWARKKAPFVIRWKHKRMIQRRRR